MIKTKSLISILESILLKATHLQSFIIFLSTSDISSLSSIITSLKEHFFMITKSKQFFNLN